MKVRIYSALDRGSLEVLFYEERNGKLYVAKPVMFEMVEQEYGMPVTSTLSLMAYDDTLQNLVNAAGELKIKPESSHKLEGLIEAKDKHLKDMRTIVMHTLKIKEPTDV